MEDCERTALSYSIVSFAKYHFCIHTGLIEQNILMFYYFAFIIIDMFDQCKL